MKDSDSERTKIAAPVNRDKASSVQFEYGVLRICAKQADSS